MMFSSLHVNLCPSTSGSSPNSSFFLFFNSRPISCSSSLKFNPNLDYYSILGVKQTATKEDILQAYRAKVFASHPDSAKPSSKPSLEPASFFTKGKEKLKPPTVDISLLTEAKQVLTTPTKKQSYDTARDLEGLNPSWDAIRNNPTPNNRRTPGGPLYKASSPFWSDPFESVNRAGGGTTPGHVKAIEFLLRPKVLFVGLPVLLLGSSAFLAVLGLGGSAAERGEAGGEVEAWKDLATGLYHLPDPAEGNYHTEQRPNLVRIGRGDVVPFRGGSGGEVS